jgi:hypothetical protein
MDPPGPPRRVVMLESPRDAAARAIVYRRRTRERPRERVLRVVGLVGTLLVHLVFLFGAVLGSAYELGPVSEAPTEALQVRLIDKPEPPPPPPVRGAPPKQAGPTHHGSVSSRRRVARVSGATPSPPQPPVELPKPDVPVISIAAPQATIKLAPMAAPRPPVALPRPQPTPELMPVPLSGEPPQIVLDTPPAPPVPPRFQPEPVRKPQAEGTRPLPTPPSLAMPALPAQSPPVVSMPTIALDTRVPKTRAPASTVQRVRPTVAAAPPAPALETIPLPAQTAPQVNLQPQLSVATPTVPRERPQVQVPTIQLDQPQIAAVPPASPGPIEPPRPPAPTLDTPAIAISSPSRPAIAPAQVSVAPVAPVAPVAVAEVSSAPATADTATEADTDIDTGANRPAETDKRSRAPVAAEDVSRAPQASAQGQNDAAPGQAEGVPPSNAEGSTGRTAPAPAHGQGEGEGKQGKAQPGAAQGERQGRLGSYVELKPRGDTQIMSHGAPDIGYQPTRFAGDWTPEGESSVDTALRHAVEKTTIQHTFRLPRGVRVKCKVIPLFPMALLGCGNGDPPPKPVAAKVYDRMHLAPAQPLAPPAPAASVAASTAVPVTLDHSAECAAARISGGPLPPGCEATRPPPLQPTLAPASTSSSWVPASDQFH